MLFNIFLKKNFFRFCQSGLYIDFFLKQLGEILVRNIFVYTSLFFGEKYMIEVFTKKIISNFIFKFNNIYNFNQFFYMIFFLQFISFLFYLLSLLNLLIFLI
uniref:ymf57 n=1 Tax=Cryptocaryon irritans TaxID=153251 RepID=UPI0022FD4792|nr:ymf57 [Cryptocaryon irritans]WBP62310.1 ymf57 [Cryptocaryon irritans]